MPTLEVQVEPLPRMPAASVRPDLSAPAIEVVERALGPRIDGVLEGAWQRGRPAERVRSLLYKGPPHPDWAIRAWVSESELALGLQGVARDAHVVITVDPDASRRGWLRVTLADGQARFEDCRATSEAAEMPVVHAWSVATWGCRPPLPAHAQHGADGWEVALPWTAIGPTTDDLQVNVRIEHGEHSLSLDPFGGLRDYTPRGRTLATSSRARRDTVRERWDRVTNTLYGTLKADLPADAPDEIWAWELTFAGKRLDGGRVTLSGASPQAELVAEGIEPTTWPYLVARKVSDQPLAPGAWNHIWYVQQRGTLATPVYTDTLVARIAEHLPQSLPVEVRDARGWLLGRAQVEVPRGLSEVRIRAGDDWPDLVEVRVGDRFVEGWLPAVRAGASRRRLGAP